MDRSVAVESSEAASAGARAWELLCEVMRASKPYIETVANEFELTPQQLFALKQLSNDNPLAMSELASSIGCDASNVTAIADKLESRGLVERRTAGRDRRIKALVMTEAGVELRRRIQQRMELPPPAISNLAPADRESLCIIFRRALDSL